MLAQVDKEYFKSRPTAALRRVLSRALFEGRPVTTRGRWANPLFFAHFWLEKHLPPLKKVEAPLFIVGVGRSGTTILGTLMSLHPQVGLLNEPKAMWHAIYKDEDINGNYTLGPARYCLDEDDVTVDTKTAAHRLFGAYLAIVRAQRVVDKNPELVFRIPFIRTIFPDAKFIFLVRSGWDTCYSIDRWSARNAQQIHGEVHDWWGINRRKWKLMLQQLVQPDPLFADSIDQIYALKRQTDMAAVEWIVSMRAGLHQMKQYNHCIQLVRYEDLIANPRVVLSLLLRFSNLPLDERLLSYGEHTLSPVAKHPRFDVHPSIRDIFVGTLNQLGYEE